jgi:hypothetical protein
MHDVLSELILDFHERSLPELVPRNARLAQVSGKIDVVVGMRRSGKTYFCNQVMQELLGGGMAKTRILYLNFEDERLLPLNVDDLRAIPDTYFRLYPDHKKRECWFFFDELQRIEGWEMFCRRLLDNEKVRLVLTGSSARLLSTEIATSLRGRSLTTEMFPYDFQEYLRVHDLDADSGTRVDSARRAHLEKAAIDYVLQGGFPEVQHQRDDVAAEILQQYVDLVLFRDVVERHSVSNTVPLRHLLRQILGAVGNRFSVNKFYNTLRSQGISCTKHTLYEHLDQLADAYLLYQVPIHSMSEKVRTVNPRKVYVVDSGLAAGSALYGRQDYGALLENAVFMHLRRSRQQIEYVLNKDGTEVDFLATRRDGNRMLVQASWSISAEETREREFRALNLAMDELGMDDATVVTAVDPPSDATTENGTIHVLPAWRWFLLLQELC